MKLCKDCIYYSMGSSVEYDRCLFYDDETTAKMSKLNKECIRGVDKGIPLSSFSYHFCDIERSSKRSSSCGYEGKNFKQRV